MNKKIKKKQYFRNGSNNGVDSRVVRLQWCLVATIRRSTISRLMTKNIPGHTMSMNSNVRVIHEYQLRLQVCSAYYYIDLLTLANSENDDKNDNWNVKSPPARRSVSECSRFRTRSSFRPYLALITISRFDLQIK